MNTFGLPFWYVSFPIVLNFYDKLSYHSFIFFYKLINKIGPFSQSVDVLE